MPRFLTFPQDMTADYHRTQRGIAPLWTTHYKYLPTTAGRGATYHGRDGRTALDGTLQRGPRLNTFRGSSGRITFGPVCGC